MTACHGTNSCFGHSRGPKAPRLTEQLLGPSQLSFSSLVLIIVGGVSLHASRFTSGGVVSPLEASYLHVTPRRTVGEHPEGKRASGNSKAHVCLCLVRSLESPSQSCEAVHRGQPAGGGDGGGPPAPLDDSDLECDTEPPKWQDRVPLDERRLLKPKEMKRQDVINGGWCPKPGPLSLRGHPRNRSCEASR